MNARTVKTLQHFSIFLAALMMGFSSANTVATELPSRENNAELIYQSKAANPNIHGYRSSIAGQVSSRPELIYVSQAYGPAIHSYTHMSDEIVVPWNVEYVDTAYGQAIYSYNEHQGKGVVDVLPLEIK